MDFKVTDEAAYPRSLVFQTHRDDFATIAPRMPEVASVERRSRSVHADGTIEQVHRWHGSPAALPFLLRPLVPTEMLEWDDESRWDPHRWLCTWSVRVPALGPMADIQGTQTYEETPTGCRLHLKGSFEFHPERVPRLRLPPGSVTLVERIIVAMIVPMIQKSGRAVVEHLEAQG